MAPLAGWITLVVSVAMLIVGWFGVRTRRPQIVTDVLTALSGAGIGLGGLLLLHDVGLASWIVAPAVLLVCGVLHERVLFAGDGPLRT
jgi:hypothetical protein